MKRAIAQRFVLSCDPRVMQHDDDFGGLVRDMKTMSRRGLLGFMAKAAAGLSLLPLVQACSTDSNAGPDAATNADGSDGLCTTIPGETEGPYPGDGTNGPNALTISGIERSDIRSSIGTASGSADGVMLTVTLTLVSSATCEPLVGYSVYLWHCDRAGDYSMYTGAAVNENYLRGVQLTDANGQVTFTTIFPGCYSGRWPHIHFEIFNGSTKKSVSQLALPKASCDAVYATSGYETSVSNLANVTLARDTVFGNDGGVHQMATVTGMVNSNLASTLTVPISA